MVISVAPMLDRTDRHFRVLIRCISRRTLVYTEMVTTRALLFGHKPTKLDFDPMEHPISLQIGGDDPRELEECARLAEQWGYDEINMNIGCPSDRVQSGNFGVCLMGDPERVRDGVLAMREACKLPITVKHRIGFDHMDSYEDMLHFVDVVAEAGAARFSVHARKAWLKGLSPKENRTIPPLRHEDVYRLKRERPQLQVELNGGVTTLEQCEEHLKQVDAVMIGRAAYDNPFLFADVDRRFYGEEPRVADRFQVVHDMIPYVERRLKAGDRIGHISRHMAGLFSGQPGGKKWRRALSDASWQPDAGPELLLRALDAVPRPGTSHFDHRQPRDQRFAR